MNTSNNGSPQAAFKDFIQIFHNVINKNAPMKNLSRKEKHFWQKPWITSAIKKSVKTKNKFYRLKFSYRKMFTLVNGISSKMNDVTCGIPQTSTLRPLLFTLYVNDLPSETKVNVKLFADDTNLTMSHYKDKKLQNNVNNELENISDWMRCNKLSINFSKTEYLQITRTKIKSSFEIKINNPIIKQNSCSKYLGIHIKLTWKMQVSSVCSKIARGVILDHITPEFFNFGKVKKLCQSENPASCILPNDLKP